MVRSGRFLLNSTVECVDCRVVWTVLNNSCADNVIVKLSCQKPEQVQRNRSYLERSDPRRRGEASVLLLRCCIPASIALGPDRSDGKRKEFFVFPKRSAYID